MSPIIRFFRPANNSAAVEEPRDQEAPATIFVLSGDGFLHINEISYNSLAYAKICKYQCTSSSCSERSGEAHTSCWETCRVAKAGAACIYDKRYVIRQAECLPLASQVLLHGLAAAEHEFPQQGFAVHW